MTVIVRILGEGQYEVSEAAATRLADDFQPLTDLRAGGAYRMQAAGNLLHRFYLEHGGAAQPTRTAHAAAATALE